MTALLNPGAAAGGRRAIVMVSFGDRPWVDGSAETFRRYARACGADFRLERTPPPLSELPIDLPDRPGRRMKAAFACKSYLAWKHLARSGYDQVMVVDDSACVRAGAPDAFARLGPGEVAYTTTSDEHAERSFGQIRAFLDGAGRPQIDYDPARYASTGVMLYDAGMAAAIAPKRLVDAAPLLMGAFPHQTMSYYLLTSGGARFTQIPKAFNAIPALQLPGEARALLEDVTPHLRDHVHIYHLTRRFKRRERLMGQMAEAFLAEWDGAPLPAGRLAALARET